MNEIPNLDCMHPDDLNLWLAEYCQAKTLVAKYFPCRTECCIYTAELLAEYAEFKLEAMWLRTIDKDYCIREALSLERLCDKIYKRLPIYARW